MPTERREKDFSTFLVLVIIEVIRKTQRIRLVVIRIPFFAIMCVDLQKTSKNSKSCNGREKEGGEDSSEMAKF